MKFQIALSFDTCKVCKKPVGKRREKVLRRKLIIEFKLVALPLPFCKAYMGLAIAYYK